MAMKKSVSLKGISRELTRVETQLAQAARSAEGSKQKALSLKIKKLKRMNRELMRICKQSFNIPT